MNILIVSPELNGEIPEQLKRLGIETKNRLIWTSVNQPPPKTSQYALALYCIFSEQQTDEIVTSGIKGILANDPGLPIIVLSAKPNAYQARATLLAGAVDYLQMGQIGDEFPIRNSIQEQKRETIMATPPTILIIENNETFAKALQKYLRSEKLGHIEFATSLGNARKQLTTLHPQLMIVDLAMEKPDDALDIGDDYSGVEFARDEFIEIPKIVLTGMPVENLTEKVRVLLRRNPGSGKRAVIDLFFKQDAYKDAFIEKIKEVIETHTSSTKQSG
ncbi:MAG TPA: hypothetical protein PK299_08855 [Anaerolineales bacterium]|nr:hypothetical protein [Anaerolineales bacterium]